MEQILDNANPTIEEVRDWGYNQNVVFIDQDEDLILHQAQYVHVLMELASDVDCPKNNYCLDILQHFTQINLASRNTSIIFETEISISQYRGNLSHEVEKWKGMFFYLLDLIRNPQQIDEQVAEGIAHYLTVGDFTIRQFQNLRTIGENMIEYLASTESYKEYIYIDLQTAFWRASKYSRLDSIDF
jgi:hypothetical protein